MLLQYVQSPVLEMWQQNGRMSRTRPVLVFDQRRACSSSLREALQRAAERLRVSHFIPCYGGVPCTAREFPRSAKTLYAYHLHWGEQSNLERFPHSHRSKFSCYTNFREPLQRVQSCACSKLSHITKQLSVERLSQLSTAQLLAVLLEGADSYGVSCLNEPFRIFSGECLQRWLIIASAPCCCCFIDSSITTCTVAVATAATYDDDSDDYDDDNDFFCLCFICFRCPR